MAQDIVSSLFGVAPQAVQASITNPMFERAAAFAQMNPMQQAQFGLYSGGAMLGQGVAGLLGGEDPRLVQARQMQQVKDWIGQSGVDINTPEGLQKAAQYAQSIGATEGALFLGQQAMQMRRETTAINKTEEDYMREKAFREEVAKLPPEQLNEEVLMQLAAKYGTTSSVMSAMSNLTGKREAIAARQEAAAEKLAAKEEEKQQKLTKAKENALAAIGPILETLDKTMPMVGATTAGLGGWAMGMIPGTTARDLKSNISTIKANLGFQQLQAMRDASPTGGALGQVAVQELKALQDTVAALDPEQSPAQLKANMQKVYKHYTNWKKTLEGQLGIQSSAPTQAPQAADNDPLGIRK